TDRCAARCLDLAEKNPKDPVAVDALVWVFNHTAPFGPTKDGPRAQAMETLLRKYLESSKLSNAFGQMASSAIDLHTDAFLRSALEKSPHREVQGRACLALARVLNRRASTVQRMKDSPQVLQAYQASLGKEATDALLTLDS